MALLGGVRSVPRMAAGTAERWLKGSVSVLDGIRPYKRSWLSSDVVAGITLAALAIPEVMGYTKIAGMPVITGLYNDPDPDRGVRALRLVQAPRCRRRRRHRRNHVPPSRPSELLAQEAERAAEHFALQRLALS
jgi:hypothetical protein